MYTSNKDGNSIMVDAQEWEELKVSNAILKDLNNKLIRAVNWLMHYSVFIEDHVIISDEIAATIHRVSNGELRASDEQRVVFCDRDSHEL